MSTRDERKRAIPTIYRGTRFRAIHEANYAAFFDFLNWKWTYEAITGEFKIVDILLETPSRDPILVEVKWATDWVGYMKAGDEFNAALEGWRGDRMVVGATPAFQPRSLLSSDPDSPIIGYLYEWDDQDEGGRKIGHVWHAQPAYIWCCRECGFATLETEGYAPSRAVCGPKNQRPPRGHGLMERASRGWIEERWGWACAENQYRHKS